MKIHSGLKSKSDYFMETVSNPKSIGIPASNVAYISSKLKPLTEESIGEASIRLALKLQRTLDITSLIATFCQETCDIVPCDSVAYRNDDLDIFDYRGEKHEHICQYSLELEDHPLGLIECTRQLPFSEHELQLLESLLTQLVFPLRNAILYHNAISLAHKDPLTQIANRTAFDSSIESEVSRAQRHSSELCLFIIDIDHFKHINDENGHLIGDQILKIVAQKLQASIRKCDLLFRYGGEEFVVLLPNTDLLHARLIAERLRMHIASELIKTMERKIKATVSIGVSEWQQDELGNTLFHRADQALYQAKHQGRNQVRAS